MDIQPKKKVGLSRSTSGSRRWPAEWEAQDAIWFAWPHNRSTWPGHYTPIQAAFVAMVNAASDFVAVKVLATAGKQSRAAKKLLTGNVEIVDIATNDCWIRDYGPTFVHDNGHVVGIDWQYNAWGGKYPPWDDDAAAASQICSLTGQACESSKMTLEGGAIEGDGAGRLLTTPICLHNRTRNAGWSRDRISRELHKRLGVVEIVWVDGGSMVGDDTDGHIDQLARFVTPSDVVVATSADKSDPNAVGLSRNLAQLQAWAEQTSPTVKIHKLPTPPPREIAGQRMPESYCNFLMLADKAILVPTFGNPKSDRKAIALLRSLCPKAKVIAIDASDFIFGRGAWHCASQQQPAPSA